MKALVAADESKSMINSADEDGWAPLHSAASSGNIEIVEMLLSKGKGVKLNFLIFAYGSCAICVWLWKKPTFYVIWDKLTRQC